VPEGFVCDGASVPRPLWFFRPPDGLHRAAAVAHDWLYANKGSLQDGRMLSREECDDAFQALLHEAGVGRRAAWLMHRGVRLGGWMTWRKPKRVTVVPVLRIRSLLAGAAQREWAGHLYAPH
jgi:hypothetical protein